MVPQHVPCLTFILVHQLVLLSWLSSVRFERLYIVGDFINFFHLYEHHGWSRQCNRIIRRVFKRSQRAKEVSVCVGNHDAFLGVVADFLFDNVRVQYEFIHENEFVNYLVIHDDHFDRSTRLFLLMKLTSFMQTHFHGLPFVKMMSSLVHNATRRYFDRKAFISYAHNRGCERMIFGHIHHPENNDVFVNCGDWVQ